MIAAKDVKDGHLSVRKTANAKLIL